jgi:hypothetical protein
MACFALLILYVSIAAAAKPGLTTVISSKGGTIVAEPLKARTSGCTEINAEGGSTPEVVCRPVWHTKSTTIEVTDEIYSLSTTGNLVGVQS